MDTYSTAAEGGILTEPEAPEAVSGNDLRIPVRSAPAPKGPVCSYTEWEPLEEVILGSVEGATIPAWHTVFRATLGPSDLAAWEKLAERQERTGPVPYPPEMVKAAERDLEEFRRLLEGEGVVVRRPDPHPHDRGFATPAWSVMSGFSTANPRDAFLVVGDEIIEAPMADRGRYFETWPYRTLLNEYSRGGARWSAAPRPQLVAETFSDPGDAPAEGGLRYATTEFEPVFDAADFVRCGRDIIAQRSHVTNAAGISWLQRHLGPEYRVHTVRNRSKYPIHIDTTLIALAPGKMLVNPDFLDFDSLPPALAKWDLLVAPKPQPSERRLMGAEMVSPWINANMLSLDEERVVVERSQTSMIRALKDWGFKPIPCSFENYYPFIGSFHCATLDVRRRGELRSYF